MEITPLTPIFAAEIEGVELAQIDDEEFDELYRAWVEYGVLRVRAQALDDLQLEAFSARFGPLEKIPVKLPPEVLAQLPSQYVTAISNINVGDRPIGGLGNSEANWHSDMTFLPNPPPASILLAVEIPEQGGNTQFCCQHAALEAFPEALREQLPEIRIKHDASHTSVGELRPGFDSEEDPRLVPGASHPALRSHEENGRDALYLGRREFASVEGMEPQESEQLLDVLWSHASLPENVWTQVWEVGDVIIWDNRRVLHRRDAFPQGDRRLLKRCQVLARDDEAEL